MKNSINIGSEYFENQMQDAGWMVFESIVDIGLIEQMRLDIKRAYERCREIQIANKIPENNAYTVHHLIGQEKSFIEYLQSTPIHKYVEKYFSGPFILNSFGGAINSANNSSYAHNIHRDIRSFSGSDNLMLNTLVMLDDFTVDNGATWMLSGSHKIAGKPTQPEFDNNAVQAVGKAGSILLFNSNVWHAGGDNKTDKARRSITPMYSKPFMKQQFDYPRAIGYSNQDKLSDEMQQIIGFNSRTPETLEEWYQPPSNRMYKQGQG